MFNFVTYQQLEMYQLGGEQVEAYVSKMTGVYVFRNLVFCIKINSFQKINFFLQGFMNKNFQIHKNVLKTNASLLVCSLPF